MGTKSNRSSGTQHNPRGATQGVTLVCSKTGNPIDCVVDSDGKLRLAVDASVSIVDPVIEVNLDVANDGVHIGDLNTGDTLVVNPDGSINVVANVSLNAADGDNVAISAHPEANQIFDELADSLTTDAFEEIYEYISSNDNTRIIKVECTVSTPATFQLKINGNVKKQLRSSSLERNVSFKFDEHKPLANGDILSIEARVERLISTSYDSFTSLEGYLV